MSKTSTAKEYLKGIEQRSKTVALDRGMSFEVSGLSDTAIIEFFKASGRMPGEKLEGSIWERMTSKKIVGMLEVVILDGVKKPKIVMTKPVPKGALHFDDILFTDKMTLFAAILDCTGLGESAADARADFPAVP